MALKNKNQSISLSAQKNINIGRTISNSAAYREHRTECLEDQTALEDAVYAIVDSMAPKESTNETI
jgi:hypothetical protein